MAIDWNADVGVILKSLFSKEKESKPDQSPKSPYAKLLVPVLCAVVALVLLVVFVLNPLWKEREVKQNKVNQIASMRQEVEGLREEVTHAAKVLEEAQLRFDKITKLFHTNQELEDLYRHISRLALIHNLLIATLEKNGEKPVFELDPMLGEAGKNGQPQEETPSFDPLTGEVPEGSSRNVAYYKIQVKFEITGNYGSYTLFRRDLAQLEKIVNIDKETIHVVDSKKKNGNVQVIAVFSTYRLPSTSGVSG